MGEAFSVVAMLGAAEAGALNVREESRDKPRAWGSAGLLVAWFAIAVVLAWRA